MFDADMNRSGPGRHIVEPNFESLEPRLMLTTMNVGDWFVYRGALGQQTLVTLNSVVPAQSPVWLAPQGQIELMAQDETTGDVMDLSGMLNGSDVFGGISGNLPLDRPIPPDTAPWIDLEDVLSLGANATTGEIYGYDNVTGELWTVDPLSGVKIGMLGVVTDVIEATYGYDITAMTVDANGIIYAVGTIVDLDTTDTISPPNPAGPFLITIDPSAGPQATRVPATGTDLLTPQPTAINDITFVGGQLYGTDGTNLFTINLATAAVGGLTPLMNVSVTPPAPITNMMGLESADLNGTMTLFGTAGNQVFIINQG
ncbi:hypothetical protein LCGC14_1818480, partial [marine sediment metagenome]